jgi:hypothetical protein
MAREQLDPLFADVGQLTVARCPQRCIAEPIATRYPEAPRAAAIAGIVPDL